MNKSKGVVYHVLYFTIFVFLVTSCNTSSKSPSNSGQSGDVTVMTEKNEYDQAETIRITVINDRETSIWYAQKAECGASFWSLESCANRSIQYYPLCDWELPQHDFTALAPGETLHGEWDGRVEGSGGGTTLAPPGCYQIVFPYALQEKRAIGEGWGDDQVRVSSNPFTIN